jgi:uncharacterized protein YbjT (DUF2867 family)
MILLTGATGRVGSVVSTLLADRGDVRVLARDPSKVTGHPVVHGDLRDPASVRRAADGIDTAFVCSSDAPDQDDWEISIIDALQHAGVRKVVKLSAQSAAMVPPRSFGVLHRRVEEHLVRSSMTWVSLRPTFFQESLLLFADDIRKGVVNLPSRNGATSMVAIDDVGAVAAHALTTPDLDGRAVVLTGPAPITFRAAFATIEATTGKAIKVRSVPRPIARVMMPRATGMPSWLTNKVIDLLAAIDSGEQAVVSDEVELILGRPATPLAVTITRHRAAFT